MLLLMAIKILTITELFLFQLKMEKTLFYIVCTFVLVGSTQDALNAHQNVAGQGSHLALSHHLQGGNIAFGTHAHIAGGFDLGGHGQKFFQSLDDPKYIENEIKKLTPISAENLIEEEWKTFKVRQFFFFWHSRSRIHQLIK